MNDWMRLLRGLNSAAITRMETKTASWGCLSWACEGSQDCFSSRYSSVVDRRQGCRERAVDEGAVYEEVYVVEAVFEDCKSYRDRDCGEAQQRRILQEVQLWQ